MKKLVFLVLVLTVASASVFAGTQVRLGGKEVIRIEVQDDEPVRSSTEKRMLKRIRRLEMAVAQLQEQVFMLTNAPVVAPVIVKEHACYIKTSFHGTVLGKGSTETEARAKTLEACEAKTKSTFYCNDEDVKCEMK